MSPAMRLVSRPHQVEANVRRYADEVGRNPALRATVGYVQSWYALRLQSGRWIFAPSKFVGYQNMSAKLYSATFREVPDGARPERALERWFSPVDPDSRLGQELVDELEEFLDQWGKQPRRRFRISVVGSEDAMAARKADPAAFDRISVDPRVCGGRPCIKGTRMRVSDIVEMLASGATTDEILDDYPYLKADDIAAALSYAARAVDHRVVRAA